MLDTAKMRQRKFVGWNRAKGLNRAVNKIVRKASRSSPKKKYSTVAFFLLLALVHVLVNNSRDDDDDGNRYLLFYSHSGFSNQLIGMERVAYLALATNRTLVLPPVVPHKTRVKIRNTLSQTLHLGHPVLVAHHLINTMDLSRW